jgi:hypothetical protein
MDLNKSLEQLENDFWGESTHDSELVQTCHKLRKKPLKDFEIEDLRVLIGQNISLDILIPCALIELEKDILADGGFYEGDLLLSVLKSDPNYWSSNSDKWAILCDLISKRIELIENSDISPKIKNDIFESFDIMTTMGIANRAMNLLQRLVQNLNIAEAFASAIRND